MALEMRKECERCTSLLAESSIAYICVHECTFCEPCTENMKQICPNCGGELVRRPRKQLNR
ncbi:MULTISPECIES: DUF1272 domain-containing protein [Bacillaceae]|uniref:DUF1272 domain-containing protein n=1 Tax=Bacillaceae TaxID=186817 RepID=UPI001E48563A|nr:MULTISPECIES: DUF1272 domain-containing protein [Bacillaceae]MCE4048667.1 DUF1272 domain-containing protein [Bacillus sp. Au-Bac7]MCM3032050.1 DUF1272 domain-containing protein [Niallia sp. MER 6]UPO90831.1 DUF1272 domain-containing protein [Niallia sp. Man26]